MYTCNLATPTKKLKDIGHFTIEDILPLKDDELEMSEM